MEIDSRAAATVATCITLGVGGGIIGSMAAPAKHREQGGQRRAARANPPRPPFGPHGGPPVHSEEVVLNRAGTAFITETGDDGTVKSIAGNDVTITESANGVPYKDITVALADGATVYRNGTRARVSDLKVGDHMHVSRSSEGTFVFAADSAFRPPPRGRHGGPGPGDWHEGPGPGDRHGGPSGFDGDGPPPPPR